MTPAQERDKRTQKLLAGKGNGQPDNIQDLSAYQNQLMQIQAERQQNLALAKQNLGSQQQAADIANSAAAMAVGGPGGVAAGTGATLAKYGMPLRQTQTQKTTRNVQTTPNRITINNNTTVTNNNGPVQGRPVQMMGGGNSAVENQSRFQTWVSKVFAKQKESNDQANRYYEKREWSLARSANKMMEKISNAGKTVANSMDPKQIGESVGSQFKTLLMIFGMTFLAKYWTKVLDFAKGTYDFLDGTLTWLGLTDKGRQQNLNGMRGTLRGDLWWFFTGEHRAPRNKGVIDMFVDGFKNVIDYFKTWLGGQMDIRKAAIRNIKFPDIKFEKSEGGNDPWGIGSMFSGALNALSESLGGALSGVSTYLGDILTAFIDPKSAAARSTRTRIMASGMKSSKEATKRDSASMFENHGDVNAGDAAVFGSKSGQKKYSLNSNALDSYGALIDGDRKHGYGGEISQGRDILGAYKDARESGVIDTDRLISGLHRLYDNAKSSGGVVVDKEFMMHMFGSTNAPGVRERRMKLVEADMTERDKYLEAHYAGGDGSVISNVLAGGANGVIGEGAEAVTGTNGIAARLGTKYGAQGVAKVAGLFAKGAALVGKAASFSTGLGWVDTIGGAAIGLGRAVGQKMELNDKKYVLVPEDDPRPGKGGFHTVYELTPESLDYLAQTKFGGAKDFSYLSYDNLLGSSRQNLERYAGGADVAKAKFQAIGSKSGFDMQLKDQSNQYYLDKRQVTQAIEKADKDLNNTALSRSLSVMRQNTGELAYAAVDKFHSAVNTANNFFTSGGSSGGNASPAMGGPGVEGLNRVRAWLWGGPDFPQTFPNGQAKSRMDQMMAPCELPGRERDGRNKILRPVLHVKLHSVFQRAFTDIYQMTDFKVYNCGVGYSFRVANDGSGRPTNRLSNHSFGSSVDINADVNRNPNGGVQTPASEMSPQFDSDIRLRSNQHAVVRIMKAYGFEWGGNWSCRDTMHFEFRDLSKIGVTNSDIPTGSVPLSQMYTEASPSQSGGSSQQAYYGQSAPNNGGGGFGDQVFNAANQGLEYVFGPRSGYYSQGGSGYSSTSLGYSGTLNSKGAKISGTIEQRSNYVMARLIKEAGLTPQQAAGIVGNLINESNINYTAVGDGGKSVGIAQWHKGNWDRARNWAAANNVDINSLEGQVTYMIHGWEDAKKAYGKLSSGNYGLQDSANYWGRYVERYDHNRHPDQVYKRQVEGAKALNSFNGSGGTNITYVAPSEGSGGYGSYENVGFNASDKSDGTASYDMSVQASSNPTGSKYSSAGSSKNWSMYSDAISVVHGYSTKEAYEKYYNGLSDKQKKIEDSRLPRINRMNLIIRDMDAHTIKKVFGTDNVRPEVVLENASKLSDAEFKRFEDQVNAFSGSDTLRTIVKDRESFDKWVESTKKSNFNKTSAGFNRFQLTGSKEMDYKLYSMINEGWSWDRIGDYLTRQGISLDSVDYFKEDANEDDIKRYYAAKAGLIQDLTSSNSLATKTGKGKLSDGGTLESRIVDKIARFQNEELYKKLDYREKKAKEKLSDLGHKRHMYSLLKQFDDALYNGEEINKLAVAINKKDSTGRLITEYTTDEVSTNRGNFDVFRGQEGLDVLAQRAGYANYSEYRSKSEADKAKLEADSATAVKELEDIKNIDKVAEGDVGVQKLGAKNIKLSRRMEEVQKLQEELNNLQNSTGKNISALSSKEREIYIKKVENLQKLIDQGQVDIVSMSNVIGGEGKEFLDKLTKEAADSNNKKKLYDYKIASFNSIINSDNILKGLTPEKAYEEVKRAFGNDPEIWRKFETEWPSMLKLWNSKREVATDKKRKLDNHEMFQKALEFSMKRDGIDKLGFTGEDGIKRAKYIDDFAKKYGYEGSGKDYVAGKEIQELSNLSWGSRALDLKNTIDQMARSSGLSVREFLTDEGWQNYQTAMKEMGSINADNKRAVSILAAVANSSDKRFNRVQKNKSMFTYDKYGVVNGIVGTKLLTNREIEIASKAILENNTEDLKELAEIIKDREEKVKDQVGTERTNSETVIKELKEIKRSADNNARVSAAAAQSNAAGHAQTASASDRVAATVVKKLAEVGIRGNPVSNALPTGYKLAKKAYYSFFD